MSHHTSASGYFVDVIVDRLEKLPRSPKSKNPRYRFHTDHGTFITESDIQQTYELNGDETGPAVFLVEDSKVRSWSWVENRATAGSAGPGE